MEDLPGTVKRKAVVVLPKEGKLLQLLHATNLDASEVNFFDKSGLVLSSKSSS